MSGSRLDWHSLVLMGHAAHFVPASFVRLVWLIVNELVQAVF